MIFLSYYEFLERKPFLTLLICTSLMWLQSLGPWEVGLCSLVLCASNQYVTSSSQAGDIPRGETAAVALTMDSSQLSLPYDTPTACVPQVYKHTCTPPWGCLRMRECGCRLGCEVDVCGCAWGHTQLGVVVGGSCVQANLWLLAEHIPAKLIISSSRALQYTNSLCFSLWSSKFWEAGRH